MVTKIDLLLNSKLTEKNDVFIFTSVSSIRYFSGFWSNFEAGPSPFQVVPAALIIVPGQGSFLLLADNENDQFESMDASIVIRKYSSYIFESKLEFETSFYKSLFQIFKDCNLKSVCIGVEPNALPLSMLSNFSSYKYQYKFTDVSEYVGKMKIIKTVDEIENIKRALSFSDLGQTILLNSSVESITEIELFNIVRNEIEKNAGQRIPIMMDLVSGKRTAMAGGNPLDRALESNDIVISDIVPNYNGYWGDSCNTVFVGQPTLKQKKQYKLVSEALQIGIENIRPGVKACAIDEMVRNHLKKEGTYGHHTGHGIGTTYHEEPRIVGYNKNTLKPGMVIALEPAIYTAQYGIRLEHTVLVTASGCEVLTKFKHAYHP